MIADFGLEKRLPEFNLFGIRNRKVED